MLIPRSRGAVSGVLLILLGAFGALIPLVGPYFDFTTDSGSTWDLTSDTLWLSVVPGAAAVLAGAILLTSTNRATAALASWLGIAAGAWFVVGNELTDRGVSEAGKWEGLAAFDGLGALIAAVAAFALGRLAVRSVRDEELAREAELADRDSDRTDLNGDGIADGPRRTRESGRFDREAAPVATTTTAPPTTVDDRTDTMSAADRVREAADRDDDRGPEVYRG